MGGGGRSGVVGSEGRLGEVGLRRRAEGQDADDEGYESYEGSEREGLLREGGFRWVNVVCVGVAAGCRASIAWPRSSGLPKIRPSAHGHGSMFEINIPAQALHAYQIA